MEENNNIDSFDYSKIDSLIQKQEEIIANQQKIIDYFIPSEEEINNQKKQEEKELKEQQEKELKEKELKEQQEKELKEQQEEYNNTILSTLESINTSVSSLSVSSSENLAVNSVSSGSIYLLLFTIVFTIIIYYLYRLIRTWFI